MRIVEVEEVMESKMVWAKRGTKIVRKVRCTSGPRKGRMVSSASQCSKPINLKKRMTLKKTRAKMGKRMARKAARTKRRNPTSKRVARLNRRR
jgi:hypothetical protein|tara:strand:+ start:12068 stop:12346 length:279 start_codon:yes stop_codon:yes gene_type:complete